MDAVNEVVNRYPTPSAARYGSNRGGAAGRKGPARMSLESLAQSWPTPQARDECGPTGMADRDSLSIAAVPGKTAGRLNPAWVATLMGFPSTWLDTLSPPAGTPNPTRGKCREPLGAT